MASPTRSVGTTKTASCGAFNVAFVAYLIAMMVGAAEQHAQIPSTPGTAIGVGFCAAALAFTLSEFALWAFSRAGRCPSHSPACVPPRYNVSTFGSLATTRLALQASRGAFKRFSMHQYDT